MRIRLFLAERLFCCPEQRERLRSASAHSHFGKGIVVMGVPKVQSPRVGGIHAIPELAPHWRKLDLREVLRRRAAFVSISQTNSVYEPWGAQGHENHRARGSLEATIRVVQAARRAKNFVSFNWVGYSVFREDYAKTIFDEVQYAAWVEGKTFSPEQKRLDNELVPELKALVQPGDLQFNELALQSCFIGTPLPLELARKRVEVIVFTGIHLDWCVEGNTRAARDHGYLPIVIGDATGCQRPEDEAAAMDRINRYFAPVISSYQFVELLEGAEGSNGQQEA